MATDTLGNVRRKLSRVDAEFLRNEPDYDLIIYWLNEALEYAREAQVKQQDTPAEAESE